MKLLSRKKSVGYVCLGQTGFNCVEDQHSILLHHTIEIGPVGHVHQLLAARQEGRAGRGKRLTIGRLRSSRVCRRPASTSADMVVFRRAASSRNRGITVSSILRVVFIWIAGLPYCTYGSTSNSCVVHRDRAGHRPVAVRFPVMRVLGGSTPY